MLIWGLTGQKERAGRNEGRPHASRPRKPWARRLLSGNRSGLAMRPTDVGIAVIRNGGRKRDERRRHRRRIWRRVLSAEPPERADGGGGASGGKDQASVRIDWTNRLACSTHLERSSRER